MITNIHKNSLGTISFKGKFAGMRKSQEFDVYPLQAGSDGAKVTIQSDTRIGIIFLRNGAADDGRVYMSGPHASGAYFSHLATGSFIDKLNSEELLLLRAHIMTTASGKAGDNGMVLTDNSEAISVFAA